VSPRRSRLLVVAPHPDDETLGAGGTIAGFARAGGEVTVLTIAAHMPPLYPATVHEQTVREAREAHKVLGVAESIFLDYPAVLLAEAPVHELNRAILEQVRRVGPDVILAPFADRHVDHKVVFAAVMVAARPVGSLAAVRAVVTYEVPSETHWTAPHIEANFVPNWFVDITATVDLKLEAMACYASQVQPFPGPRSVEALRALALFRGSQTSVGYAEAFQLIRFIAKPEDLLGPTRANSEGSSNGP
jgi:N-acetylglucosamine malate deacetylase 1